MRVKADCELEAPPKEVGGGDSASFGNIENIENIEQLKESAVRASTPSPGCDKLAEAPAAVLPASVKESAAAELAALLTPSCSEEDAESGRGTPDVAATPGAAAGEAQAELATLSSTFSKGNRTPAAAVAEAAESVCSSSPSASPSAAEDGDPAAAEPAAVEPAAADAATLLPLLSAEKDGPAAVAVLPASAAEPPATGPAAAEALRLSPAPLVEVGATADASPTAAAPEAAKLAPAGPAVLSSPSSEEDKKAVEQATAVWIDTVVLGTSYAPRKAADLYAVDAVLWGTEVFARDDPLWGSASELVRNTPEAIYAYYDYFARLPKLRLVEYTPAPARVRGDFASQAGTHTFAWRGGADGETSVEVRARFSLTFRRDGPRGSPDAWAIVEHGLFLMPAVASPPGGLKHVVSKTDGADKEAVAEGSEQTAPSSPMEDATPDGSPASILEASHLASSAAGSIASAATAVDQNSWKSINSRVSDLLLDEERSMRARHNDSGDSGLILDKERAMRAKQIADLQYHADQLAELHKRAEAARVRAEERAVARAEERKIRAKREMALEKRAEKAKALAAELTVLLAVERARRKEAFREGRIEEEEEEDAQIAKAAERIVLRAIDKARRPKKAATGGVGRDKSVESKATQASRASVKTSVAVEKVKSAERVLVSTAELLKKHADAVLP